MFLKLKVSADRRLLISGLVNWFIQNVITSLFTLIAPYYQILFLLIFIFNFVYLCIFGNSDHQEIIQNVILKIFFWLKIFGAFFNQKTQKHLQCSEAMAKNGFFSSRKFSFQYCWFMIGCAKESIFYTTLPFPLLLFVKYPFPQWVIFFVPFF